MGQILMSDLTSEQINAIVINISEMLNRARTYLEGLDALGDAEYMHGRSKYPLTGIVYSGFMPDHQNIPGMTIQKTMYGQKNMYLPELLNDDIFIQLYNSANDVRNSEEVKRKYRLMGDKFRLLFFMIDETTRTLQELELCK